MTPPETSTPPSETSHDIPDWLKGSDSPAPETIEIAEPITVNPPTAPVSAPEITPASNHEDIPDWLKGSETVPETVEAAQSVPPATEHVNETVTPVTPELPKEEPQIMPIDEAPAEEHIPDWLKGTQSEEKAIPET